MQPQEKREFLRVPFTTEVEVRTEDRSFGSSSGINISLNGLKLATEQPVPEKGSPWTAKIMLRAFEKQVILLLRLMVGSPAQGRGPWLLSSWIWILTATSIFGSLSSVMQTIPDAQNGNLTLIGGSGGPRNNQQSQCFSCA
jgi:hypothetical protein